MDRFTWHQSGSSVSEEIKIQAPGVCLYDGEEKTGFEVGAASLTPFRLIWADYGDPNCRLSLHHSLVLGLEKIHKSFMKSGKILLHLAPAPPSMQGLGPVASSKYSYVRLSFRQGNDEDGGRSITPRTGITGIQNKIQADHSRTSQNISQAFEDLSNLMKMARDMVQLSKSISEKIRARQGEISDDETVEFKSYLLSLGVADPVTKDSSGSNYYGELARELANVLSAPLKEKGGLMTLSDVYCRINRARGLELISPDDLLHAAKLLNSLDKSMSLLELESGVMVVKMSEGGGDVGKGMDDTIPETLQLIHANQFLDSRTLANSLGISPILAKERLLYAERAGAVCRDETVEGLNFYPNKFNTTTTTTKTSKNEDNASSKQ